MITVQVESNITFGNEPQQERECKCVHISQSSKTDGTPYLKGYCPKCKAWVYTEKKYCLCCRRLVSHNIHHLRLRRIYNQAIKENTSTLKMFESDKNMNNLCISVEFRGSKYQIPIWALAKYANNEYTKETMYVFQDALIGVRRYNKSE